LVAPEFYSRQLSADFKSVRHVYAVNQIFPNIYDLNPNLIVLDYSYISNDVEKIVRRIRANNFYSKIKICCYKTKAEPKADSLLKAIGVDYFIYEEELQSIQKNKNPLNIFTEMLDRSAVSMLTNVSN